MTFIITAFGLVTKILRGRVGMGLTFGGDGWGWIRTSAGMDVKFAGTGGDGAEIPSPCTPLLYGVQAIETSSS